jgi:hypothetical protein
VSLYALSIFGEGNFCIPAEDEKLYKDSKVCVGLFYTKYSLANIKANIENES